MCSFVRRARYPQGVNFFRDLMHGLPVDYDSYFGDMTSIVDCIYAFQELRAEYPSAKIVLTIRDMDAWWRSYKGLFAYDVVRLARDAKESCPDRRWTPADEVALFFEREYGDGKDGKFDKVGSSLTDEPQSTHR